MCGRVGVIVWESRSDCVWESRGDCGKGVIMCGKVGVIVCGERRSDCVGE